MDEHANHRKRLREQFLANGLDSFNEHQVVELLLFYGIPRIDTNVIAHRLIKRFGSLREVLDADYSDLTEVEGIGDYSATLIKFSAALSKRYAISETSSSKRYDTVAGIGDYLVTLFMGETVENVYTLLFNGKLELLGTVKMAVGSTALSTVSPRALIDVCVEYNAAGFLLAHNHPTGLAVPSSDDIEYTTQLDYLFNQIGFNMLEHFVVAGNSYTPIIRKNYISTAGEQRFRQFK